MKMFMFRFWAWWYAQMSAYKSKDGGKTVRVSWRYLWCISMMETAKQTSDAFVKYNNPFNFTEGSWMGGMLRGTYKGESDNMANFKSMRLGVKAWYMWAEKNGFMKETRTGKAIENNDGDQVYALLDMTTFMSEKGFYTANSDTYYQACLAYANQSKQLTSPRVWLIVLIVVVVLLLVWLFWYIARKKKLREKYRAYRRKRRMNKSTKTMYK